MPKLLLPEVLSVDEVILHIVDPPVKTATANRRSAEDARGLRPSERALPRSGTPSVHDYFRGHIERALGHSDLRAAVFLPEGGGGEDAAKRVAVQATLGDLVRRPGHLVEGSVDLAERLHELMVDLPRVSAGDLAVCLCRGQGGDGDWGRFVALLKIDSTEGFPQVIREAGGKSYVTVDLSSDAIEILPTSRQPVQKAAFVRPRGSSHHDLLLLDRQTGGLSGHVARFFAFDFLGARVEALGGVPQTDAVYDAVLQGLNEVRLANERQETRRHESGIAEIWARDSVSIEEVGSLFSGEARRKVEAALRATLPAEEVELDLERARRLTERRKFRGSGGLVVTALASQWADLLHSERFVPGRAGREGHWEIVLHTEEWTEVP